MDQLKDTSLRSKSPRVVQEQNIIISMSTGTEKYAAVMVLIPAAVFLAAELAALVIGPFAAIIHGILLIGLVNLYYFRRDTINKPAYLALMAFPLTRLLSLVLPVPNTAPFLGFAITGLPLLSAAWQAARINGLPPISLRLGLKGLSAQAVFGLVGIPLGILAFKRLPFAAMLPAASPSWMVAGAAVLILFGGFLEEFLFRGIVQQALKDRFGFAGVVLTSILYAGMFVGSLSAPTILFYGGVGLLFSLWVNKTKSLWGVILAHGLLNLFLWLILPLH